MDGSSLRRKRIAVVGSGISGLSAAWLLHRSHDVTLHEALPRFGGHAHTQDVVVDGAEVAVDSGFIVFNTLNYPNLTALFAHLGVATHDSDMSFAVSLRGGALEYAGGRPLQMFAQPSNLLRPRFHRMLWDLLRFYREATALARAEDQEETLGQFLERRGYGEGFVQDHLLPMGAAIWSSPLESILDFPMSRFARFFDHHGLLRLRNRAIWRTVTGGSRRYVARIIEELGDRARQADPVERIERSNGAAHVHFRDGRTETVDAVVLAVHADTARSLLASATPTEASVLSGFATTENRAVLHTDPALMPRRRSAWASWNYIGTEEGRASTVAVTYWMNLLQGLKTPRPLLVTLNPPRDPAPGTVLAEMLYRHPRYDLASHRAQARLGEIQGAERVWFCGAWCGDGFHEDGIASAVAVARALGCDAPWSAGAAPAKVT